MLFNSRTFILAFLPVTWLVFALLSRYTNRRITLGWLVLASLFFYGYWEPKYLVLIISSVTINYLIGSRIVKWHHLGKQARSKAWLVLSLVLNLGALGYFKYANFFVDNVNAVFGSDIHLQRILLPLAISFFTFQQVAYIVDCYRGQSRLYNPLDYSFFILFFPQLIAGPILQHDEIVPQAEDDDTVKPRLNNLIIGLTIFVLGLFKKVVLADGSAELASPVFNAVSHGIAIESNDAWLGVLAYSFQLYFDFSGYSDMAVGIGRMFGFTFPINFNSPYQATNIIDFWRRWHITLSRFLRDYLYIPLGGNRKGPTRRYVNLFATMLLGGLWHGAGWTFVIWGALHGFYLIVNHFWRHICETRKLDGKMPAWFDASLGWFITMVAVLLGWIFFRADSFGSAITILKTLAGLGDEPLQGSVQILGLAFAGDSAWYWIIGLAIIAVGFPAVHRYMALYDPILHASKLDMRSPVYWKPNFLHGLFMGVLVYMIVRKYFVLAPTEFLYFNF